MKRHIEVFVRTRPTNRFPVKNITIDEDKGLINVNIPKKKEDGLVNHQQENWTFNFDKILVNETQERLFEMTGTRVVDNALEGRTTTCTKILVYTLAKHKDSAAASSPTARREPAKPSPWSGRPSFKLYTKYTHTKYNQT